MADPETDRVAEVVDGGDVGCGELLLRLVGRLRHQPAGAVVRLVATDPAAPIDLPAWCHLTGHAYLGSGRGPDGRPHYDLQVAPHASQTDDARPWHLRPTTDSTPTTDPATPTEGHHLP